MNTLLRYFQMLLLIPRAPGSISTPDLLKKLRDKGYQMDIRTVQRDLNKLSASGLFPFTSSEGSKPLCWFWPKHAPRLQLPLMTADEALTFKLVEQFLKHLLPHSVKDQLAAYFTLADRTLKATPLANWADKVRIISNTQTLLPARIDDAVLTVVYEALLKSRRFTATYRPRKDELKTYEVNPLGLIFKGSSVYLAATLRDYHDIKQLAMHRFSEAALIDKATTVPSGFSLDRYIAEGEFDYPLIPGQSMQLTLKINDRVKKHLSETPLSVDQQVTRIDESSFQLQATVKDTLQLRWWLRSFAADVEVLEPLSLREEFVAAARALNLLYCS
ncbi:WYL domain-containing protein [Candidatus Methylobacter favarea]|uniref:WYL domain-containing protein n=1 Tax=Candidatus Methylobacter favarea TaxID=2707345 RepID=A0A8S0X9X4_9GAMM|nr:WYL domain-containing protein [Candidatus Methylobacter favarea]CAA9892776.1 WYL domain-containing protein [Candidatus Methylobacter favarea]